ncbi:MAG TPA: Fe-S cluster assembly ATPase SufC [Saprospiraceae bacterium]|nr:Fe-S cluster assembly ATPase SufC [Saprospiraceae bacterium]
MLIIKDLIVKIGENTILKGINLTVRPGEVHAIMGPNGSGKSTLGNVIAGREEYEVVSGSIDYFGEDLLEFEVDERAQKGIFLSFQYPIEIPGVSTSSFLKQIVNSMRKNKGMEELSPLDMLKFLREKVKQIGMDEQMLKRSLNEGFSGGEKKRNEILQLSVLEPRLAILDETDSGLDIDALKVIAEGVNSMRDGKRSFIIITHYQRLLNYIVPDYVHVLHHGKIARSGDKNLALELEEKGYDWIRSDASVEVL